MEEVRDENSFSTKNPGEARVVLAHAAGLLELGLRSDQLGIITPYNDQAKLILVRPRLGCRRSAPLRYLAVLKPSEILGVFTALLQELLEARGIVGVEVSSVDGFQVWFGRIIWRSAAECGQS